jgi:hypothetical protein
VLGALYKLAKRRAFLQRVAELTKRADTLPQYSPTPLSSLTARADYIANRKYKPEKNPLTSDEQELMQRLLAGMSRSRARVVGAHRRGRKDVRSLLTGTSLWG